MSVVTETGLVYGHKCNLWGIVVGTDGSNDVTVDIHDGVSDQDPKALPSIIVKGADPASNLGGLMVPANRHIPIRTSLYCVITTAGTAEVSFLFERPGA